MSDAITGTGRAALITCLSEESALRAQAEERAVGYQLRLRLLTRAARGVLAVGGGAILTDHPSLAALARVLDEHGAEET